MSDRSEICDERDVWIVEWANLKEDRGKGEPSGWIRKRGISDSAGTEGFALRNAGKGCYLSCRANGRLECDTETLEANCLFQRCKKRSGA